MAKKFSFSFYKCKVLTLISRVCISRECGELVVVSIYLYCTVKPLLCFTSGPKACFLACERAPVSSSLPQLTLEIRLKL